MSITPQQQGNSSDSREINPDWCHVQETISMLCLAVVQIEASLKDGANSVAQLTSLFTNIAGHATAITSASSHMNKAQQEQKQEHSSAQVVQHSLDEHAHYLSQLAEEISIKIHDAVCTFQFYDRVNQRLDHVVSGLSKLGDLIGDPSNLSDPHAWDNFQQEIKSSYSMECERLMFEQIMRGATVEEALEVYKHNFEDGENCVGNSSDEIELF